jgi:hypothetical protein
VVIRTETRRRLGQVTKQCPSAGATERVARLGRCAWGTFAPDITSRHTTARTMSVLLETSLGDITIDLLVDEAPKCCEK